MSERRRARTERLRGILDKRGLSGVLLRRNPNFAWYTGGADSRVDRSSPGGVADILVTRDAEYVVTNNIEAQRMREEQTPDIEVVEYRWYESPASLWRELTGGGRLGADLPEEGQIDLDTEITPLRWVLDDEAVDLYRQVGKDARAAMEEVLASLTPGMSEWEASAALEAACRRRGMYSPVVMAAAEGRIETYRHPVTKGARFERRVMLVICAERGGLYANVTRFLHFEEPDEDLRRRFAACEEIVRRMRLEATQAGRTLAEAFADCRRFYAEAGFPDEWQLHHQGGMTGYATRELIATPHTNQAIETGQAFAWNPSVTGAKAEETFVLTASGPELLT